MSEQTVMILVAVVLGAGLLGVAAYYLVRFLRGSIKVSLPSSAYNPGDAIAGSFELHARKPIQGKRLVVSLIGVEVTRTREDGKRISNGRLRRGLWPKGWIWPAHRRYQSIHLVCDEP